jgi:ribosomal protein S18 acetylase RimI-like enzyme
MSAVIRPALQADAAAIRDMIWALASYHGDRAEVTTDFFYKYAFAKPEVYGFFLLELAGAAQGFAKYNIMTDFAKAHKQVDLDMLWVNPAARGQGHSTALIRAVCQFALQQGCTSFRIAARKGNPQAIAIYQRLKLTETDKGDSVRFIGDLAQLQHLAT